MVFVTPRISSWKRHRKDSRSRHVTGEAAGSMVQTAVFGSHACRGIDTVLH